MCGCAGAVAIGPAGRGRTGQSRGSRRTPVSRSPVGVTRSRSACRVRQSHHNVVSDPPIAPANVHQFCSQAEIPPTTTASATAATARSLLVTGFRPPVRVAAFETALRERRPWPPPGLCRAAPHSQGPAVEDLIAPRPCDGMPPCRARHPDSCKAIVTGSRSVRPSTRRETVALNRRSRPKVTVAARHRRASPRRARDGYRPSADARCARPSELLMVCCVGSAAWL